MSPSTHGTFSAACVVRACTSGNPNIVKAAGGSSVRHSASIAAIFILWFSLATYPDSSPSTTTESAHASPKLAATAIERFAMSTLRPRIRYQALTASTNTEPTT